MKRSEQDIRFQWDLTKIYPDTAAWEAAMQEAEARACAAGRNSRHARHVQGSVQEGA